MQAKWLFKNSNVDLIIFFNGWGMDENPFSALSVGKYDILMLNDYRTINLNDNLINECNKYKNIHIIAWSMGVWAANTIRKSFKNITSCLAINGTPFPVHNSYGIPSKIYDFTLNSLDKDTIKAFYQNMFASETEYEAFMKKQPQRNLEECKEELASIKKQSESMEIKEFLPFNKVIIGKRDKIISVRNQIKFWQNEYKTKPVIIDAPHYIFEMFGSWDDLINYEGKL